MTAADYQSLERLLKVFALLLALAAAFGLMAYMLGTWA